MLVSLHIKNIAVIDELTVDFSDGFNVLTGETGAGKSIIIDSLNMVLGQRTSRELIRGGQQKAVVEALFNIQNPQVTAQLADMGFEVDEGNLLLYRDLSLDGRGTSRVNAMLATAGMLKEISKLIVNIHGQHDNQALLSSANHVEFLDDYADIAEKRIKYKQLFTDLKGIEKQISKLVTDEHEKASKAEFLEFQINEIESARLNADEHEQLLKRREYLSAANKIASVLEEARSLLYSGESENPSAHDILSTALRGLSEISDYDETLFSFHETLNAISIDLDDISHQIIEYAENADFNPAELDKIEERLDIINRLERKYKADIPQLLEYCDSLKQELDDIIQSDEIIKKLKKEYAEGLEELKTQADKITALRKAAAQDLEQKIMSELGELDMEKVNFKVDIQPCEFNEKGADSIEFLISTNVGELPKPLSKIASGGEMSRIMLAIKSILADTDDVATLIFDEIDAGISGRAAFKAAQKLHSLSLKKQIICITHLAQIACMAKSHFLIEKDSTDDSTKTNVKLLDQEECAYEIARITGGAQVTEKSLANAKEMLTLASRAKER
ncbi:MAG: DNA repair protein RecN [Firmicutes bacterium]|nr:DNA repair protein RecN [Bacillota bacterium]